MITCFLTSFNNFFFVIKMLASTLLKELVSRYSEAMGPAFWEQFSLTAVYWIKLF